MQIEAERSSAMAQEGSWAKANAERMQLQLQATAAFTCN
jgi:hypothetical protein